MSIINLCFFQPKATLPQVQAAQGLGWKQHWLTQRWAFTSKKKKKRETAVLPCPKCELLISESSTASVVLQHGCWPTVHPTLCTAAAGLLEREKLVNNLRSKNKVLSGIEMVKWEVYSLSHLQLFYLYIYICTWRGYMYIWYADLI